MKKLRAPLAVAVVLVFAPTAAFAAGARISWQAQSGTRYELFLAQPDEQAPRMRSFRINKPRVAEDGSFYFDVHDINPLQPAYFLMMSINSEGLYSTSSNVIELGSESFCQTFDVDRNGKVTATDALAVARKAVGLDHGKTIKVKGSIILAFEILKMIAALQCI